MQDHAIDQGSTITAQGACAYRFTMGTLQCVTLNDGFIETPASLLAPEIPAGELRVFLLANGENPDIVRTPLACLLLNIDGLAMSVPVDSGFGGAAGVTSGHLPASLRLAGHQPQDIGTVLVSHIHPDHIGGLFAQDANFTPHFPWPAVGKVRMEGDRPVWKAGVTNGGWPTAEAGHGAPDVR